MDFFNPLAFATGMLALINPCGFALLPAYLGMFLNQKDGSQSRIVALNRAQGVGLALSLGIVAVFAVIGVAFSSAQGALAEVLPFFTVLLGVVLLVLGIRMIFFGYELKLDLPKLNKGGSSGSFAQMFLFGVSYALASLTCTIGLFIGNVGLNSASDNSFTSAFGGILSYGIGMGLLATVLTLMMALGKRGLVKKFNAVLPKVNLISGLILLLVGPYMVGYGIWELQLFNTPWPWAGGEDPAPVFAANWVWLDTIMGEASAFQTWLNGLLNRDVTIFGRSTRLPVLLGWPFLILNFGLVVAGFVSRRNRRTVEVPMDTRTVEHSDDAAGQGSTGDDSDTIEISNAELFDGAKPTKEQFTLLKASGYVWNPDTQTFRKSADGEPGAPERPWLEPSWSQQEDDTVPA